MMIIADAFSESLSFYGKFFDITGIKFGDQDEVQINDIDIVQDDQGGVDNTDSEAS